MVGKTRCDAPQTPAVLPLPDEDRRDTLGALNERLLKENRRLRAQAELAAEVNARTTTLLAEGEAAKAGLAESESYLKTLLDILPVGIIAVDAENHRILEINAFAGHLSGRSEKDLVGRVCHGFICPAEVGRCPITDLGNTVDQSERVLIAVCDFRPEVPKTVVCDPARLRQILWNLVGNAIKFTDRGEIVLRVELARRLDREVVLHFSIRDTGIGIDSQDQQRIFGAFEQADSSFTRTRGGTGLGLAISSQLVRLFGGELLLESQPGQGSRFHFDARFGLPSESARQPRPAAPDSLAGLQVLVADDNASNLQLVCEFLDAWGMAPTAVTSGQSALDAMRRACRNQKPFPLVLIDADLPDMDGCAVARRIKEKTNPAPAIVIMLSTRDRQRNAPRIREQGGASLLMKPVGQAELLEAMLTALGELVPIDSGRRRKRPPAEGPPELRKWNVLVVEDNQVNQILVTRILQKRGCSVSIASDGREAVQISEQQPFDVILMDIEMPRMGGFEATALIRENERGAKARVPIVALTAHATTGCREECLNAGMDGYLSKPISPHALIAKLDELLLMPAGSPNTSV